MGLFPRLVSLMRLRGGDANGFWERPGKVSTGFT